MCFSQLLTTHYDKENLSQKKIFVFAFNYGFALCLLYYTYIYDRFASKLQYNHMLKAAQPCGEFTVKIYWLLVIVVVVPYMVQWYW